MLKKITITILLLIIAITCFAQAPENWYKDKPILNISFKGLNSISEMELNEIFKPYKKKLFTDEIYWEILQKIYALDYFTDIKPKALPADNEYSSVLLEFEVIEKPSIKNIVFKGNNKIGKSSLQSAITIKKGDIYSEANMKNAVNSIKAYYLEKGYTKATASAAAIPDEQDNTVTIEYTIEEGKMSVISKILFEGNATFPEKALKKALVSREARLIQTGAFKENALQEDKLAIKMFYGEKGYIDAHVETIKKEIDDTSDPQKDQLTLTYVIMEGEQFKYSGTSFEGNSIFSSEELGEKIKLQPGDIFNLKTFELGFTAVADTYFENGYTSNYIDKKEIRNDETKEIGFIITIVERDRSHIEKIIIKGNKKTKDHVILRELLIKEGDVFSKTKFVNSFRNLFNLRYFSSVVPEVQPGSEQDLVDVIINVEEQSTANIQFGVSFTGVSDPDSFPMSVFAQWEEKNLMGDGRELSATFNAGTNEQSLTLGFTENYFLGTPLYLGFNFSTIHKREYAYQDILFPIFPNDPDKGGVPDPFTSYEEFNNYKNSTDNVNLADAYKMKYHNLEFKLGLHTGYRWFPNFATITLAGGINFGIVKNFYNSNLYRPVDASIRNEQAKWRFKNNIWTQLSLDDRDIIHDPSKGWFLSQRFTFYGIFPKIEDEYYFQSDTIGEAYFTLLDYPVSEIWNLKFVLAFFSGFTFQVPTGKNPIGYKHQLTIDGVLNGRGWTNLNVIGNVMQKNWIEFRWPLAHGILSFDFFFEAIALKKDLKDLKTLKIDDYYFSFGPGLRFSIPQFPLRLMFANTFKSVNWKPVWGNGKKADWKFVISFNIINR